MARIVQPTAAELKFSERFHALTAHLSEPELAIALGRSVGAVRGLRGGPTKMLKLDAAVALCRYLTEHGRPTMPWDLLGEEPITPPAGVAGTEELAQSVGEKALAGMRGLETAVRQLSERVAALESPPARRKRAS